MSLANILLVNKYNFSQTILLIALENFKSNEQKMYYSVDLPNQSGPNQNNKSATN